MQTTVDDGPPAAADGGSPSRCRCLTFSADWSTSGSTSVDSWCKGNCHFPSAGQKSMSISSGLHWICVTPLPKMALAFICGAGSSPGVIGVPPPGLPPPNYSGGLPSTLSHILNTSLPVMYMYFGLSHRFLIRGYFLCFYIVVGMATGRASRSVKT